MVGTWVPLPTRTAATVLQPCVPCASTNERNYSTAASTAKRRHRLCNLKLSGSPVQSDELQPTAKRQHRLCNLKLSGSPVRSDERNLKGIRRVRFVSDAEDASVAESGFKLPTCMVASTAKRGLCNLKLSGSPVSANGLNADRIRRVQKLPDRLVADAEDGSEAESLANASTDVEEAEIDSQRSHSDMEDCQSHIDSLQRQLDEKEHKIQDEKKEISQIRKSIRNNKAEEERLRLEILEIGCYEFLEDSEASQNTETVVVAETDAVCDDEQDPWEKNVDKLLEEIEAKQAGCPTQASDSPRAEGLQTGEDANQLGRGPLVAAGEALPRKSDRHKFRVKIVKKQHKKKNDTIDDTREHKKCLPWDDDTDDDSVDSKQANQRAKETTVVEDSSKKPDDDVDSHATSDDEQDPWEENVKKLLEDIDAKQARYHAQTPVSPNATERLGEAPQEEKSRAKNVKEQDKENQLAGKKHKKSVAQPVGQNQKEYEYEGWIALFRGGSWGLIYCEETYKVYKCDVFFLAKECNERPKNTPQDRNKQTWWQRVSFDLTINDRQKPQAARLRVHPLDEPC